MIRVIILCVVFSLAASAVIPDEAQAKIIKYKNSNDGKGNYKFSYETSNGITREEHGYLVNIGEKNEHIVVEGSYTYTDVDGNEVIINYIADENGYQIEDIESSTDQALPPAAVASLLGK